jgi:hypothetical protein
MGAAASFVLLPLERLFHYILYVLDGKDAVLLSVGSSVVGLWDRSRYHFTNRKSILFSDLDKVSFGLVAAITYGIGS